MANTRSTQFDALISDMQSELSNIVITVKPTGVLSIHNNVTTIGYYVSIKRDDNLKSNFSIHVDDGDKTDNIHNFFNHITNRELYVDLDTAYRRSLSRKVRTLYNNTINAQPDGSWPGVSIEIGETELWFGTRKDGFDIIFGPDIPERIGNLRSISAQYQWDNSMSKVDQLITKLESMDNNVFGKIIFLLKKFLSHG